MSYILSNGQNIGNRYEILRFLDEGGMQQVYVAFDTILNRQVALKTPKNTSAEKRFKRSAILSAKVNHPNVAKTLDYVEENGRSFLIEELISGRDLGTHLKEDFYHFDPHLAAQFGHHIAKGLAASHHEGVVHRDLKPGNIMLEYVEGQYCFKVTDFGIAKLVESEFEEAGKDEGSITGSQTMMGAIPYMAPEMIKGVKNAGSFSDVWAFGSILYRLISGDYPFGTGLAAIPLINVADLPKKPDKFKNLIQFSWLVDELLEIICKCLVKDPKKRPTADELVLFFSSLCYGDCTRYESTIQSFKHSYGNFGFIYGGLSSYFFHEESFYGDRKNIVPNGRVQFSPPKGIGDNRVHPVLPLKKQST